MLKRLNPVRDKTPKASALPLARISNRVNKACKFFPCHQGMEDCTFCYCPFYPCLDAGLGGYVTSPKFNKMIWSCKACDWIHRKKVTKNIFDLIRKNQYWIKNGTPSAKMENKNLENDKLGVIILSHGSKLKKANARLNKNIKIIKQKMGMNRILPGFLQFCRPDLAGSIKKLAAQGCRSVVIIPFFLFDGNHVTRDIPQELKKEKAKYPQIRFTYTKNLGEDKRIADIVVDILKEVLPNENIN